MSGEPRHGSYGASSHYDDRYYAWQSEGLAVQTWFRLKHLRHMVKPTDTVVDFGCAAGAVLGALPARRKIGVELNDLPREAAARDFGIETYRWIKDVPDGVADVVISSHTLEHLEAPIEALKQLRPKLKSDGKIVLVLPIDDWRSQRRWERGDINQHLYTWTPMLLGNCLTEAGFEPVDLKVARRTLMRGADRLARMPSPIFDVVSAVFSIARHRQELIAIATPRP